MGEREGMEEEEVTEEVVVVATAVVVEVVEEEKMEKAVVVLDEEVVEESRHHGSTGEPGPCRSSRRPRRNPAASKSEGCAGHLPRAPGYRLCMRQSRRPSLAARNPYLARANRGYAAPPPPSPMHPPLPPPTLSTPPLPLPGSGGSGAGLGAGVLGARLQR